jgi:hypothetical protein
VALGEGRSGVAQRMRALAGAPIVLARAVFTPTTIAVGPFDVAGQVVCTSAGDRIWLDGLHEDDPALCPLAPDWHRSGEWVHWADLVLEREAAVRAVALAGEELGFIPSPTIVARTLDLMIIDGAATAGRALAVCLEWSQMLWELDRAQGRC